MAGTFRRTPQAFGTSIRLPGSLLFVFGARLALGGAAADRGLLHSRIPYVLSTGFVLFALAISVAERIPELRQFGPEAVACTFIPNDKTNLAPYRVVHLVSLVFIVVSLIPVDWPGLKWPIFSAV